MFAHIPKQVAKKLDARVKATVFISYQDDFSNYRVYNPEIKKVHVCHQIFLKNKARNNTRPRSIMSQRTSQKTRWKFHSRTINLRHSPWMSKRVFRDRARLRIPPRYANVAEYITPESYAEAMSSRDAA